VNTPLEEEEREPVLDPVERVSEMCFGLFMALTFVGAVNAAGAGQDVGRTVLFAALGCNLAWGLVDAVMYLVRTVTERGKRLTLATHVQAAGDAAAGVKILHDELPPLMRDLMGPHDLEALRARIASAALPEIPHLHVRDFTGALGIFVIVVLSTFPVALPFVLMRDMKAALLVSRLLTFAMLFGGGFALARHAGAAGWKGGLMLVGLGVALTVAIIALGG